MKITQEDREAAKQEQADYKEKNKMSAAAAARLRDAAQREKANTEANTLLVEAFNKQVAGNPQDIVEIILEWLYRIAPGYTENLRARAIKAAHFHNQRIQTVHDS